MLAIQYVYEMFDIKQGILRCGDDLILQTKLLYKFLNISNKQYDFIGTSPGGRSIRGKDPITLKETRDDPFMVRYYESHPEDFENPLHNLKGVNIKQYMRRPKLQGPTGTMYYISNKACSILVSWMKGIQYDIFHFDSYS